MLQRGSARSLGILLGNEGQSSKIWSERGDPIENLLDIVVDGFQMDVITLPASFMACQWSLMMLSLF